MNKLLFVICIICLTQLYGNARLYSEEKSPSSQPYNIPDLEKKEDVNTCPKPAENCTSIPAAEKSDDDTKECQKKVTTKKKINKKTGLEIGIASVCALCPGGSIVYCGREAAIQVDRHKQGKKECKGFSDFGVPGDLSKCTDSVSKAECTNCMTYMGSSSCWGRGCSWCRGCADSIADTIRAAKKARRKRNNLLRIIHHPMRFFVKLPCIAI